MAKASGDVSRTVCANTIQENERRLREALDLIKNQVLRHGGLPRPFISFSPSRNYLHLAPHRPIYIIPMFFMHCLLTYISHVSVCPAFSRGKVELSRILTNFLTSSIKLWKRAR